MRLAVLGMGRMGHALAERLLGGHLEVTVWNRTPHRADDLVVRGAREAPTPAAAAEGTDATFTSLADDAAVLSVVTGQDGVAAGLGDGVLIDASTVSPDTTAHLAGAVGGRQRRPIRGRIPGWRGGKRVTARRRCQQQQGGGGESTSRRQRRPPQ